jgi:L-histidine N-alpha-methyltransferase
VSGADAAKLLDEAVDPTFFAEAVRESLGRTPRQLPSKYFYDELGSSLFEAICRLPWYQVTRAESSLLARHAREILRPLSRPLTLVELGCGSGDKLAILAGAAGSPVPKVQLIDISSMALEMARLRLETMGLRQIVQYHATYEDGLARAVLNRPHDGALAVLFLGSNIGNFDPGMACALLGRIRQLLRSGDTLLLGADLVKPERDLLLAYDDPLQITAAFNRNLLRRINDELGGTFDLDGFAHRAVWRADERRVEMHLISTRRQSVRISAASLEITFEDGDAIWTESSYKYEPDQILAEGKAAGFGGAEQWIDREAGFAVTRLTVA